jgi:hypothetical protein
VDGLDVLTLEPSGRVLDILVSGTPLAERLVGSTGHTCSPLGWGRPEVEAATRRRLALDLPLLVEGEREPVLVCTECGELTCGAVTARISAARGIVTWSDFAFESGTGVPEHRESIAGGPFRFEWRAYRAVLLPRRT